jgi:transcriptional antiterminator
MDEYTINSGIPRKKLEEYFKSICKDSMNETKFSGDEWEIEIIREYIFTIGSLRLPKVTILFRANSEKLKVLISDFRSKFLSAGG